ncbi:unnamed protein product [Pleuronectes platessa]|uniref:Transmembrane protein n=1 Tax=Pleuronectes platessa TaxID=8262 RepID=A0A9N7Z487_PLEPL|nr:unnamed protein product [Pleuronectes platessa]
MSSGPVPRDVDIPRDLTSVTTQSTSSRNTATDRLYSRHCPSSPLSSRGQSMPCSSRGKSLESRSAVAPSSAAIHHRAFDLFQYRQVVFVGYPALVLEVSDRALFEDVIGLKMLMRDDQRASLAVLALLLLFLLLLVFPPPFHTLLIGSGKGESACVKPEDHWQTEGAESERARRVLACKASLSDAHAVFHSSELPAMCSPSKRSQWREELRHFRKDPRFSRKVLLNCCLVRRLIAWASPDVKGTEQPLGRAAADMSLTRGQLLP